MGTPQLQPSDAVIIVDMQNDFCAGGAIPVCGGDRIVPVLNCWIEAALEAGAMVVVSRDWHPANHISFRESGGLWPAHCVQNTWGSQFHPDLKVPANALIVSKGILTDQDGYSDFEMTGLADHFRKHGICRLWIGGLAQDVCVRATVLDGLKAGFEVHLIKDATRPLNASPGAGERSLQEMQGAGCVIEEGKNHV